MTRPGALPVRIGIVLTTLGLFCPYPIFAHLGSTRAENQEGQRAPPDGFARNGVVAFQGNSAQHPANTTAAVASALRLGVEWVQVDVQLTRDGVLILLRPATVQLEGEKKAVAQLDHAVLAGLDVASGFRQSHRKTLEDLPPTPPPTLEEVLGRVLAQQRSRLLLQPIGQSLEPILALVKKKKAERWVGFNSDDLRALIKIQVALPGTPLFWDRPPLRRLEPEVDQLEKSGCSLEALMVRDDGVDRALLDQLHRQKIKVGAWNVKGVRGRMSNLKQWGCDYLCTTHPRLAMEAFAH